MFQTGHWAAALINSLEREGEEIEDSIAFLKVLSGWVKTLPGEVAGSHAAEKVESLIREAMAKTTATAAALADTKAKSSFPNEIALRFFVLLVSKNNTHYLDLVIEEAKKILDKKRGIISVSVEYAFASDENVESFLKEEIKKRTGAAQVNLTGRVNAELIGGYRLRIGDEIIDASIRSQLRKLETSLSA